MGVKKGCEVKIYTQKLRKTLEASLCKKMIIYLRTTSVIQSILQIMYNTYTNGYTLLPEIQCERILNLHMVQNYLYRQFDPQST